MSKIFSDSKSQKLRELLIDAGITESIHPEIIQEVQNFGQAMYDGGLEDGLLSPYHLEDRGYSAGYDEGYSDACFCERM